MLRAVMSAFCCWPIQCLWNKISLYEILILLFLTWLFFLLPAPNSTRESKHFQMWKIGANQLLERWMEPELCLDSVEKRTEKYRSPVIELLISIISEL